MYNLSSTAAEENSLARFSDGSQNETLEVAGKKQLCIEPDGSVIWKSVEVVLLPSCSSMKLAMTTFCTDRKDRTRSASLSSGLAVQRVYLCISEQTTPKLNQEPHAHSGKT